MCPNCGSSNTRFVSNWQGKAESGPFSGNRVTRNIFLCNDCSLEWKVTTNIKTSQTEVNWLHKSK